MARSSAKSRILPRASQQPIRTNRHFAEVAHFSLIVGASEGWEIAGNGIAFLNDRANLKLGISSERKCRGVFVTPFPLV